MYTRSGDFSPSGKTMSTTSDPNSDAQANKALVRRWFDEVWNDGNEALAAELVAPDSTFDDPVTRGTIPATHEAHYAAYRRAFPDLTFTVEKLVAEGDAVAARFTVTGTHEGAILGFEPTGESFEVDGSVFTRIEDGRIVETRPVWDALGLLDQLGLGGMP